MEHDCVESLRKLVQVQQEKIGNLETEIQRLTLMFGRREDVLLSQISSLHNEIQRQMTAFHHLMGKWQSSNVELASTCFQVNGQDLSKASHEEAVEAFRKAREPIVVEVLRRSAPKPGMEAESTNKQIQQSNCCDITTQTDWSGGWDSFLPLGHTGMISQALLANDHYGSLGSEPDQEDDGLEYEEVVLHRSKSTEKLGLTLCYGAPDDLETDIFVTEIEQSSVAAKDGRIQEGDQLLQINGVDVRNREQAISLFSDKRQDFTLLVARPQIQMEDYLLEDQSSDLTLGFCRQHLEDADDTDTATTENQHEKDSGFGRTDDSTKNDESSEHEVAESIVEPPMVKPEEDNINNKLKSDDINQSDDSKYYGPLCRFQSDISLDHEMALLNQEMENIQLECESLVNRHLEEQQRLRCQLEHVYVNLADLRSTNRLPEPDVNLCVDKKVSVERWVNSMVIEGKKSAEDSSSAYNTGDSRRSTPLTLELSPLPAVERCSELHGSMMSLVSPRMEDKGTQLHESDVASIFSCDSCRRCCRALFQNDCETTHGTTPSDVPPASNKARKTNSNEEELARKRKCNPVYPCTTMYTNQDNLQHTIWLQQQLFRQALSQQPSKQNKKILNCVPINRKDIHSQLAPGGSGLIKLGGLSTVKEEEEMKMEWKVKKRSDGTRYITRKPARNRILRERAIKIAEERTGLTTDDDAVSELKIGRYWSKEERKRHLERARDRKKKEMIMRAKMACLKEHVEDTEEQNKKETNILELSYKKMMKKRGRAVFDDFTTVQEILVHGTKGQSSGTKPLGLLSVTTV